VRRALYFISLHYLIDTEHVPDGFACAGSTAAAPWVRRFRYLDHAGDMILGQDQDRKLDPCLVDYYFFYKGPILFPDVTSIDSIHDVWKISC